MTNSHLSGGRTPLGAEESQPLGVGKGFEENG